LGIQVEDRRGILAEVTSKIAGLKTNVLKVEANSGDPHGRISVTVDVENLKHLQRLTKVIRGVAGVLEVERLMR
jgi:(p)ppGpp synthase/HD superfamily hydrolase